MTIVRDILHHKGSTVHAIEPDATVFHALGEMARHNIGAILVVEAGRVLGVLSERDYARKVVLRGESSKGLPVRRIMSQHVTFVSPEVTVEECMQLMTHHRIRHLPVLEGERLCGLVSIGDVVNALLGEKEVLIHQLEGYIRGSY